MNGISVIVCCYNSALRLPMALEYLSKQKTSDSLQWEIIIVDNNSDDNTAEVANNIWHSFGRKTGFKIINENKPGLNHARATGVSAAQYDIIIFCDDDNLLAENYVQYTFDLVHKTKGAGFATWGGKPDAYFDNNTTVPGWFEKEKANYVVGEQSPAAGDISARGYVWGAGMVILKKVFMQVINEDFPLLLTDRTGASLSSGGDSEICMRILIAGYKLYYDPQLSLKHYIPANKLTLAYNNALVQGFKLSDEILNKYKTFIFYVSGKNKLLRFYYILVYKLKYYLNKLNLRNITAYDINVLKALHNHKKFFDTDFDIMHHLLKAKTSHINQ